MDGVAGGVLGVLAGCGAGVVFGEGLLGRDGGFDGVLVVALSMIRLLWLRRVLGDGDCFDIARSAIRTNHGNAFSVPSYSQFKISRTVIVPFTVDVMHRFVR